VPECVSDTFQRTAFTSSEPDSNHVSGYRAASKQASYATIEAALVSRRVRERVDEFHGMLLVKHFPHLDGEVVEEQVDELTDAMSRLMRSSTGPEDVIDVPAMIDRSGRTDAHARQNTLNGLQERKRNVYDDTRDVGSLKAHKEKDASPPRVMRK